MAKKYIPSGYQIIDLTSYGSLSNEDIIDLDESIDGKILKEYMNGKYEKPILLKVIINDSLHVVFPTSRQTDDNFYCLEFISTTNFNQLAGYEEIGQVTKLELHISALEVIS